MSQEEEEKGRGLGQKDLYCWIYKWKQVLGETEL